MRNFNEYYNNNKYYMSGYYFLDEDPSYIKQQKENEILRKKKDLCQDIQFYKQTGWKKSKYYYSPGPQYSVTHTAYIKQKGGLYYLGYKAGEDIQVLISGEKQLKKKYNIGEGTVALNSIPF